MYVGWEMTVLGSVNKTEVSLWATVSVWAGGLLFLTVGAAAEPQHEVAGKKLYESYCGSCHQYDGGGVPMMQPELIGSARANGPVGGIVEMILKGTAALEPGMSDYGNEMPPFDYLEDDDIAEIATYVRTHFENEGSRVTAADVQQTRRLLGSKPDK